MADGKIASDLYFTMARACINRAHTETDIILFIKLLADDLLIRSFISLIFVLEDTI